MRKMYSSTRLSSPHKSVALTANEKISEQDPSLAFVLAILGLHFGLALLMRQFSLLATAHAYLTLAIGLLALTRVNRQPERLLYVLAYIAGVDLIWRGGGATIFYEIGKYALIGFSFMGLLLQRKPPTTWRWPLVFTILLAPSIFVMPYFNRQQIAFHLAGPVALAVASMYMSTLRLTLPQFKRMLLALLVPSASLGFLTMFFTLEATEIDFTGISLHATSAGIGPNQVSSILGLALVAAFCYAILEKHNTVLRNLMILIIIWMVAQSMLTFSRGGLWTGLGAILMGALFLARDGRMRARVIGLALVVVPLFTLVIFPALDDFTGNTLSARLQDTSTTRRDGVVLADWDIFVNNPIAGVGPGQSKILHALYLPKSIQAHVEYSRLLAEHGIFGLAVLLILSYVTLKRLLAKDSVENKALSVIATFWALLFMGHSATRLMAVAFMFALPELSFENTSQDKGVQKPVDENIILRQRIVRRSN